MKIIKPSEVKIEEESRTVFSGTVTRQTLIGADMGKNFNVH